MDKMTLGKRIRDTRKDRGFTTEKLSELCDINATYLRHIEGGTNYPSLPVLLDICRILNVSTDYLLHDEEIPNELTEIRELAELWKRAKPSDQALVSAMVRCALEQLGQTK